MELHIALGPLSAQFVASPLPSSRPSEVARLNSCGKTSSHLILNLASGSQATMPNKTWTDAENDFIVADYFAMLEADLAGQKYNKTKHNRDLQLKIDRDRLSIERKHQNISAVLMGLNETWIPGYKPAVNFQSSLKDAVLRWLEENPKFPDNLPVPSAFVDFGEAAELEFVLPPTISNEPVPENYDKWLAVAHRSDAAGRDKYKRALGLAGEKCAYLHERAVLSRAGRFDLAKEVRWVSRDEGDGAGYDIASFTPEGGRRLIEVKTTNGWVRAPFFITRNELKVSKERHSEWRLMRLWDFARKPKAFELRPPLDRHVSLIATNFEARFN